MSAFERKADMPQCLLFLEKQTLFSASNKAYHGAYEPEDIEFVVNSVSRVAARYRLTRRPSRSFIAASIDGLSVMKCQNTRGLISTL
jgi:hypothetical protein